MKFWWEVVPLGPGLNIGLIVLHPLLALPASVVPIFRLALIGCTVGTKFSSYEGKSMHSIVISILVRLSGLIDDLLCSSIISSGSSGVSSKTCEPTLGGLAYCLPCVFNVYMNGVTCTLLWVSTPSLVKWAESLIGFPAVRRDGTFSSPVWMWSDGPLFDS